MTASLIIGGCIQSVDARNFHARPTRSPTVTPSPTPIITPSPTITITPPPTPTPTATPSLIPTTGAYGPLIGAEALNNSTVGGPGNQQVSYRFRAQQSSTLLSVRAYIIVGPADYSGGTFGKFRVQIRTDDGTGVPTSTVLATQDYTPVDGAGRLITFATPATLTAGQLYHIVWSNIDPNPTTNFSSLDGTFLFETDNPWQIKFPNTDWANLTKSSTGSWTDDRGSGQGVITPMADLAYGNGIHQGMGYIETWGNGRTDGYDNPDGTIKLREIFTVSGGDKTFTGGGFRIARGFGSADLNVRLEDGAGTLIEQVNIPSASTVLVAKPGHYGYGDGGAWVSYNFASPHTLTNGATYRLVLSTTSGTEYWMMIIREGASYGYSPSTYFASGKAQIARDGTTWVDVRDLNSNPNPEGDLQFYLK